MCVLWLLYVLHKFYFLYYKYMCCIFVTTTVLNNDTVTDLAAKLLFENGLVIVGIFSFFVIY